MADNFEAELEVFETTVKKELVKFHKLLCRYVYLHAVDKTPFDTGRAQRSWLVDINELNAEDKESDNDEEYSKFSQIRPYDIVYIHNSVPYILVLEEGLFIPPDPGPSKDPRPHRKGKILVKGGFSTQAPQGMLMLTLEEAKVLFESPVDTVVE